MAHPAQNPNKGLPAVWETARFCTKTAHGAVATEN
jgi:hypothetical protein